MIDYATLPPEINSGRMYVGAGSAPMLGAAAAWDRLAASLISTANSYRATLTELADGLWRGPSAAAMSAAAEPYLNWMNATAAQASRAAEGARAAAAAYETAHAATVPPPVIVANRAELAQLVQTNLLGQNAPAIAANHAAYGEMWAQDATAMHAYAAQSAAAAPELNTFDSPPPTTSPGGQANAAEAIPGFDAIKTALQNFFNQPGLVSNPLTEFTNSPLWTGWEAFTGKIEPFMNMVGLDGGFFNATLQVGTYNFPVLGAIAAQYTWTALNPWSVGLTSSVSAAGTPPMTLAGSTTPAVPVSSGAGGPVSAGLGRATPVGGLSVPPAWGALPEGVRLTSASMSAAGVAAVPETAMMSPRSALGGLPLVAGMANASAGGQAGQRSGSAAAAWGRVDGGVATGSDGGSRSPAATAAVSAQREELIRLRRSVAEMTLQRDALKRSAASVIRRAKQR